VQVSEQLEKLPV